MSSSGIARGRLAEVSYLDVAARMKERVAAALLVVLLFAVQGVRMEGLA